MYEVVYKNIAFVKKTFFPAKPIVFRKNPLFSNMCTFLSHCFETKNYHCVGCKKNTGIFTFQGNGAVKRFVITTSVNQNLTTNNKFQAANRFRKMTG